MNQNTEIPLSEDASGSSTTPLGDEADSTVALPSAKVDAPAPPADAITEESIALWAASIRPTFGRNRADYNSAVCDALAAAGIPPNAHTVLRVGRWGTAASIQVDVKAWYQGLTSRLKSLESTIPLAARRQANILLEQLFAVAREASDQKLKETLDPLLVELNTLKLANAEALTANKGLTDQKEGLGLQVVRLQEDLAVSQEAAQRLQEAVKELQRDAAVARDGFIAKETALTDLVATLRREVALQAAAHARELLDSNEKAEAERKRLMLAMDSERTGNSQRLAAANQEAAELRSKLEQVREQLSKAAVTAATAQAALEGAQALLGSERANWQANEARYRSDEYRLEALATFLANGSQAGIQVALTGDAERATEKSAEWLSKRLSVSRDAALAVLSSATVIEKKTQKKRD